MIMNAVGVGSRPRFLVLLRPRQASV